ncbi:MAG: homocysteine S-methyltransferase family protein [Pelagibacteraceae bacterium]|jgi:homocysteine S-methyltransferase
MINIKEKIKDLTILDGGMGQELLARGVKPISNLWSASALLNKDYHKIIYECHLDFIKAGAEIILTNTFGSRKRRLEENNLLHKFKDINLIALNLAKDAVKNSKKKIFIAGSLPPQNFTYIADLGEDKNQIYQNFKEQAKILNSGVDLFYLDVMSSLEECEIAIKSIKEFNKPFIVGIHFRKNGILPSGERFIDVAKKIEKYQPLAIMGSCVSYEDTISIKKDFQNLNIPFGFKINAFKEIPTGWKPDASNPKEQLGKNEELNMLKFIDISKEFINYGAKIIGGCCEIPPYYIAKLKELK